TSRRDLFCGCNKLLNSLLQLRNLSLLVLDRLCDLLESSLNLLDKLLTPWPEAIILPLFELQVESDPCSRESEDFIEDRIEFPLTHSFQHRGEAGDGRHKLDQGIGRLRIGNSITAITTSEGVIVDQVLFGPLQDLWGVQGFPFLGNLSKPCCGHHGGWVAFGY